MNFKNLLATMAPLLASLVNSPLGMAIRQALAQLLLEPPSQAKTGKDNKRRTAKASRQVPNEAELNRALERATPEQIAQIKRLEADLQIGLATAAPLPAKNKPPTPPIPYRDQTSATLAKLITAGFMLILGLMIFMPMSESNRAMDVMLGALSSAWTISVGYYFGEQRKNGKNGNGASNGHTHTTRIS